MAEIKEGHYSVHLGNYWDFHSGCHGSVIHFKDGTKIDLGEEWTTTGPVALAHLIAGKIRADVEIKYRKTPISC